MKRSKLIVVAAAAAVTFLGGGVALVQAGYNANSNESTSMPGTSAPGSSAAGPWPVPADQGTRAESAGLTMGPMGTAEHYHPQLSVAVDDEPVQVPADIGVDGATGEMSAVHTHTADGVIHVEAATPGQVFTLGQLFAQWGVDIGRTSLGGLRGGQVTVTANGVRFDNDPSVLRLAADQEISVEFSTREPKDAATTSGEDPP